jgi:uncharacterized protein (TIGR00304 family)
MKIITLGLLLVCIGFFVILAGVFSMAYQAWKTGADEKPDVRGGGIIMIGPIPIIFGTDAATLKMLMLLAIVLMVIGAVLFFRPL